MAIGSSPYALGGIVTLSVFFNDVEFPFTKQSLLGFLHMSESSKIEIPMVRMQLTDGIGFLAGNPGALVEGAKLRVDVTARDMDSFSRTFRVNSLHVTQDKSGDKIDMDGYLDFPKFWVETTNKNFMGLSSSQVLEQMALYVGLKYVGTNTSDTQNWHGGLDRIHTFCGKVADHGYASESSCMKLAVGLNGSLLYQDVSTLDVANPKTVFTIGSIVPGKIPAVSHLPRNSGGASNRRTGYKQTMLEYSMVREDLYRMHSNMQVNVDEGGEVNVNASIRSLISSGRQMFSAIDYGNVNDNYHRALYQNKRGTGLFSVGLDLVTPVPTVTNPGITIFDTVSVEAPQEIQEISGSYIVVSHAIMVTDQQYNEKFELTRRSAASNQTQVSSQSVVFEPVLSSLFKDIP